MAKVYYVGGSTSSNGILRCILPGPHLVGLIQAQQFVYVGTAFPADCKGSSPATIIEIPDDERPGALPSGFYRSKLPPLQFEEILRVLETTATPQTPPHELVP